MTQFRTTYERAGGHVHYSIWVRTLPTETWAKSGTGCLSEQQEWPAFYNHLIEWCPYIEKKK